MLLIKEWSFKRVRLSAALVAAVTVAACQDQGESPVGPQASAAFAKGGVGDGKGNGTGGGKTDAPGQVGKNPLPISVSISPTTAEVLVNGTQAFTATVTNSTNTGVTWSATCGTFGGTGSPVTWTAPGTAGSCTISATSVADGTKSAAATVTVTSNFYLAPNGVTILCPSAAVGEKGTVNGVEYTKRDYQGITTANAASTCTSGITGMYGKFQDATTFNADIRHWDTGDVTDMSSMFQGATAFNQPISAWNTAKVTSMDFMFYNASAFNQNLSTWCVFNIKTKALFFDLNATAWVLENSRPVWGGICPTP